MKSKITGLDKLIKNLDELQKNASDINGTHEIPFAELFNPTFMSEYSHFDNFENFAIESKFDWNDIDSIDESQLDIFIEKNTSFSSWSDMKNKGAEIWTAKKLGF